MSTSDPSNGNDSTGMRDRLQNQLESNTEEINREYAKSNAAQRSMLKEFYEIKRRRAEIMNTHSSSEGMNPSDLQKVLESNKAAIFESLGTIGENKRTVETTIAFVKAKNDENNRIFEYLDEDDTENTRCQRNAMQIPETGSLACISELVTSREDLPDNVFEETNRSSTIMEDTQHEEPVTHVLQDTDPVSLLEKKHKDIKVVLRCNPKKPVKSERTRVTRRLMLNPQKQWHKEYEQDVELPIIRCLSLSDVTSTDQAATSKVVGLGESYNETYEKEEQLGEEAQSSGDELASNKDSEPMQQDSNTPIVVVESVATSRNAAHSCVSKTSVLDVVDTEETNNTPIDNNYHLNNGITEGDVAEKQNVPDALTSSSSKLSVRMTTSPSTMQSSFNISKKEDTHNSNHSKAIQKGSEKQVNVKHEASIRAQITLLKKGELTLAEQKELGIKSMNDLIDQTVHFVLKIMQFYGGTNPPYLASFLGCGALRNIYMSLLKPKKSKKECDLKKFMLQRRKKCEENSNLTGISLYDALITKIVPTYDCNQMACAVAHFLTRSGLSAKQSAANEVQTFKEFCKLTVDFINARMAHYIACEKRRRSGDSLTKGENQLFAWKENISGAFEPADNYPKYNETEFFKTRKDFHFEESLSVGSSAGFVIFYGFLSTRMPGAEYLDHDFHLLEHRVDGGSLVEAERKFFNSLASMY